MASYEMQDKALAPPLAGGYTTTDKPTSGKQSGFVNEDSNAAETYTTNGSSEYGRTSFFQRAFDSFKPPVGQHAPHSKHDVEMAEKPKPGGELHKSLQGRHLQMIAIGGSIGTGLFVGSGGSFTSGGPAAVLICFCLIGAMLFCVVHALGELAVMFPIQGSFSVYSTRFIEPAWGFAMGWNYAMQWLIVLPLELSAAASVIQFWETPVPLAVWITIFLLIVIGINLCGVRGYGEAEFLFSSIKVIAVIGFIILAIVIDVGGTPAGKYLGAHTWHDPGAFHNGFHGLCAVFVNAAFSFSGTELVGLAAAEAANPRKTLPKATKQVFWRILIFYVVSLLLIGFIVPYDDSRLSEGTSDAGRSPFVIAIQIGQINVLPDIFNAVILIAILSVANSSTYGSSRTLAGIARIGQAPKILAYVDRMGRPMISLGLALLFGFLAYVNLAPNGGTIFNWLYAISALSSFFTWGSICLCHIRFRRAWAVQGHSLAEIPFRSSAGVIGSWFGLIFNILCLIAQFYVALYSPGSSELNDAGTFFQAYLAFPVIVVFYIGFKLYFRKTSKFQRAATMDVTTSRRALDMEEIEAEAEEERLHPRPWYKKIYQALC